MRVSVIIRFLTNYNYTKLTLRYLIATLLFISESESELDSTFAMNNLF